MENKDQKTGFRLDPDAGYFTNQGVDVIAFEDIYPAGHQGGVSILMHGEREDIQRVDNWMTDCKNEKVRRIWDVESDRFGIKT